MIMKNINNKENRFIVDPTQITNVIIFVILIIFSGIFSCTETAFLSVNKIRMRNLAEEGNKRALTVEKLLSNSDRLFSSILVGNNLVNIGASSLSTSFVISIFGDSATLVAAATGVVTFLILVFGEITPKSFATKNADTIDQEEALAVSDRIAIMNNGIIQQIGTPKEIYQRPNCVFVATFIGLSNILEAKVKITGAAKILDFGAYEVPMDNLIPEISAGSKVLVSVRPEEFEICLKGSDGLTAVVEHSVFLGVTTHYFMRLENGQEIEVIQNSGVEDTIPNKTTVRLLVQPVKINVFTEDGNTPLIVRGNR